MKPKQIILWHDDNRVLTIDGCDATLFTDETDPNLPYRWVELDTGHKFAELDGWHWRFQYNNNVWVSGWENYYEN
jgi:hypothetical protein